MTGSARRKSPAPVCQLAGAAEIKGADFNDKDTPLFPNFQRSFRPPSHWPVIGDVPAGFNPVKFPIIARHWFGVEPFERKADTGVDALAAAPW